MLERVAYYVIINNIEPYIHSYLYSLRIGHEFSLVVTVIVGTAWILSPLYGWMSDSRFGHYTIIVGCLAAYIVGAGLICSSALALDLTTSRTLAQGLYYPGLCLFALVGAPGIRATVVPFMLEQLTAGAGQRYKYLTVFVSWSYFFVNVGCEIAIMFGGYLQSFCGPGSGCKTPKHRGFNGFFWRYLLGLGSLLIAMCIMCLWKNRFKQYHPHLINKPSISDIFKMACCRKPERQHFNKDLLRQFEREPSNENERQEKKHREDVRRLANLVPFMGAMIAYFMIDSQTESSFVTQGLRMNFSDLFNQVNLPEDWTYAFDPLGVMLTVPLMLFIVKPLYERIASRPMTILPRIRWGMILAALSCALASVIESIRLSCCAFGKTVSYINGVKVHYCHSGLPIYTQVPQYLIIGISEVLATVGFMEFVLSTSPREYRCTTFGILQMMEGIARYLGASLLYVIETAQPKWYYTRRKHDPSCSISQDRESSPYYYFVILTWLMIINIIFYMIVEFRYKKYVRIAPLQRDWTTAGSGRQTPTDV